MQAVLTALLLPPLLLVLGALAGGLLAWRRGWRSGLALAGAALGLLFLATPLCAGLLFASLEREVRPGQPMPDPAGIPAAIVILAAEAAYSQDIPEVGALTLERLRAGAALHRRTGLPILVSGGSGGAGETALAALMANSLAADFGVTASWVR